MNPVHSYIPSSSPKGFHVACLQLPRNLTYLQLLDGFTSYVWYGKTQTALIRETEAVNGNAGTALLIVRAGLASGISGIADTYHQELRRELKGKRVKDVSGSELQRIQLKLVVAKFFVRAFCAISKLDEGITLRTSLCKAISINSGETGPRGCDREAWSLERCSERMVSRKSEGFCTSLRRPLSAANLPFTGCLTTSSHTISSCIMDLARSILKLMPTASTSQQVICNDFTTPYCYSQR